MAVDRHTIMSNSATPRALGYRMPAEWAPHRATWLSWPHRRDNWPAQLENVRAVWVRMIVELSAVEEVGLLVNDASVEAEVAARLKAAGAALEKVLFLRVPTADVWMRDYGPTFLTRPAAENPLAMNDWVFNAWGGKYEGYEADEQVAKAIARILEVPVFDQPVVLEGGSIDVNGAGTCLTTEQCLLHPNRNPGLSRRGIERVLQDALGVTHIVWLGQGVAGDDTDGHIDDIARFVGPRTVVCVVEGNARDENYRRLRDNYERLQSAKDQDGAKLEVVALPCPGAVYDDGSRLPASYANFYIANEIVLVPVFDDPQDAVAIGVLRELFPERRVIGLRCNDVVAGLGAIHCVTQQEPRIFP